MLGILRGLVPIIVLILAVLAGCQNLEQVEEKPNVLFIAVDDINDWTGYLGGHPQAQTPNLDKLAAKSCVFTHAYASAPVCGPSRTALMYGIYPHKSGSYGHHAMYNPKNLAVFDSLKTIPTVFRKNGYYTAGAGKIFHYDQDNEDFEEYYSSGERQYPDSENPASYISQEGRPNDWQFGPVASENVEKMPDMLMADWAIKKLKKDYEKPFFLAVGFKKPHLPWVAPPAYFDKFNIENIILPKVPENDLKDVPHAGKIFAQSLVGYYPMLDQSYHDYIKKRPELWKGLVRAYLASSSFADAMVGRVINALEQSEYAKNTIIVLWGDHGWHLGEKESWKKMTLWERGTKTPLLIRVPGAASNGKSIDQPVSLQDIYPTLIDLCNLEINQNLDGNNLAPLMENPEQDWDKPVLMSHGPGNFAIRSDEWRYIRYQNGDQELYHIKNDPAEHENLANREGYQSTIQKLQKFIPDKFVELYGPRFKDFKNLDSLKLP